MQRDSFRGDWACPRELVSLEREGGGGDERDVGLDWKGLIGLVGHGFFRGAGTIGIRIYRCRRINIYLC